MEEELAPDAIQKNVSIKIKDVKDEGDQKLHESGEVLQQRSVRGSEAVESGVLKSVGVDNAAKQEDEMEEDEDDEEDEEDIPKEEALQLDEIQKAGTRLEEEAEIDESQVWTFSKYFGGLYYDDVILRYAPFPFTDAVFS